MYTAYVLHSESRETLEKRFPPKYQDFIGHHITVEFGVPKDTSVPDQPERIRVLGYVDNGEGLEALVVSVNGNKTRKDGKTYHITWSLDRDKFSPKNSNELITNKQFTLTVPIDIEVTPKLLQ